MLNRHGGFPRSSSQGSVSVEMALVLPILITMMFGTIEFGYLVSDCQQVRYLAREAARSAAIGLTPSEIEQELFSRTATLNPDELTVSMSYQLDGGAEWMALSSDGTRNTAPYSSLVRVSVYYHHRTLTALFAPVFADEGDAETRTISTSIVTRRE